VFSKNGELIRKLKGEVRLKQKDALMFCDSAILDNNNNVIAKGHVIIKQGDSLNIFSDSLHYFGALRSADLFGDVILDNGDKKLFTTKLNYNLATKIATYNVKSTLLDKENQLTSKRGQFFVAQNEAFFKEQVSVVGKDFSMKTDTLRFNSKTNLATFLAPTLIVQDNGTQLYTEEGFYDMNRSIGQFTKSPQYLKGKELAVADSMYYDGATRLITLQGNARSEDGTKKAKANTIRYHRDTEDSELEGNANYEDDKQKIKSDTINFNSKSKRYLTKGRSVISNPPQILEADQVNYGANDSIGYAIGNVFYQDTAAKITLRCAQADYKKTNDYIKAYGNRPLMSNLVEGDTLWIRADTIISFKDTNQIVSDIGYRISDSTRAVRTSADELRPPSGSKLVNPKDTFRTTLAYNHVKMFKKNFQSVCDSLSYTQSDSLFRLFKNPIIWSDTTQFKADTLRIRMKDKKIEKIYLHVNAFIVNSTDAIYFNQIKGRDITAFFEEDELRRMKVDGNAESVYYVLDEKKAYIGVNKSICSDMIIYFGNNKVDKIKFYSQPKAKMEPMGQANHEGLKMKGFSYEEVKRPKSRKDL
jgi:lipopolysaccharide export system protein LptA